MLLSLIFRYMAVLLFLTLLSISKEYERGENTKIKISFAYSTALLEKTLSSWLTDEKLVENGTISHRDMEMQKEARTEGCSSMKESSGLIPCSHHHPT